MIIINDFYNDYGEITKEALDLIRPELKNIINAYIQNDLNNQFVGQINDIIQQLQSMLRNNIDPIKSARARSYYEFLNNNSLRRFKDNKKCLNKTYELILKLRHILSGGLEEEHTIVIYKKYKDSNGNEKVVRITQEDLNFTEKTSRKKATVGINSSLNQIEILQRMNDLEEKLSAHYLKFEKLINIKKIKYGFKWPGLNNGTIAEAFEGHFQHDHGGIMQEEYHDLMSSLPVRQDAYIHVWYAAHNKDIWFKGGDINNIQVKWFQSSEYSHQVASKLSLRQIIEYVLKVFNRDKLQTLTPKQIDTIVDHLINTFFRTKSLQNDISQSVEDMFKILPIHT